MSRSASTSDLPPFGQPIPIAVTDSSPCMYLPDRPHRTRFYLPYGSGPDEFDASLARGLRRSGIVFYEPACDGCRACVPIRVPLARFRPSRSQRRCLARAREVVRERMSEPRFDPEHLDLYNRHARHVSEKATPVDEAAYTEFLIESSVSTLSFEYRVDDRLAGLGFLDVGRRAASSVYFCWDPEFASLGLGTYSALKEIEWCRRAGFLYYYLGYWVEACPSMAYKNRFRPYERMDWTSGRWLPAGEDP